jgi:hypothetical protein
LTRRFAVSGPRLRLKAALIVAAGVLAACRGDNGSTPTGTPPPPPTVNVLTVTVDTGPAAAAGAINHAYVTVTVCAAGNKTQCIDIDHVLLDTGSFGLRLVGSVLAAGSVALGLETDAQGRTIEECVAFGGGQTWGPVALADVSMAGEVAAQVPVQIMDDTGAAAAPPATCGGNGTLLNGVAGFGANGVLGVGVFAQDCGSACATAAAPLPIYYGCTSAGACTAENVPLASQVTNPITLFSADNNGVIVDLPNLVNANGETSVQGEIVFGIATQSDNALPAAGLTVLSADGNGDFTATYNGAGAALPALIDSGTDAYAFDDPTIAVCSSGNFVGYYCPVVAPQSVFAVNTGVGVNGGSNTVNFAIADPGTFVAGAAAFAGLAGGGGSSSFTWGVPFFFGRKIYIGIEQRAAGPYTGPYYAY